MCFDLSLSVLKILSLLVTCKNPTISQEKNRFLASLETSDLATPSLHDSSVSVSMESCI